MNNHQPPSSQHRDEPGNRWIGDATHLAKALAEQEQAIVAELIAVQGRPTDIGGYYHPDPARAEAVMRPSKTLNAALASLGWSRASGCWRG